MRLIGITNLTHFKKMSLKVIDEAIEKIPLSIKLSVGLRCLALDKKYEESRACTIQEIADEVIIMLFRHLIRKISIDQINTLRMFDRPVVSHLRGIPVFKSQWKPVIQTPVEKRCWDRECQNYIRTITAKRL